MEIRKAQRKAFCRGCDNIIKKDEVMFHTYSFRIRGQNIHFCMKCVEEIIYMGDLYKKCLEDSSSVDGALEVYNLIES